MGRETHKDGSDHFHVLLDFGRKRHIRDLSKFECGGKHGNVQSCRNVQAVRDYIGKESEPVSYGEAIGGSKSSDLRNLIHASSDSKEFIKTLVEFDPRMLICSYPSIVRFATDHFRNHCTPYKSPHTAFRPGPYELVRFHSELYRPSRVSERRKGLVICGASRLGKTAWARSLGHHTYFAGQLNWDKHCEDARYAIIDDVPMEFISKKTQIFGAQEEFETSQKYQKIRTVKWGIPVLYLTNDVNFLDKEPDWFQKWFEVNMDFIELFDSLIP
jgi:hypothetical protein